MEIKIIATPNPAEIIVSADQLTVVGNGTTGNPLRLGLAQNGFDADFDDSLGAVQIGAVVFVAAFASQPVDRTCTVARASADDVDIAEARAVGIITRVRSSTIVAVTGVGVVTLTEDEWAAVTAGSAGLQAGLPYYLSADVPGELTSVAPGDAGQKVLQMGIALNRTSLMMFSPGVPVQV